jgi:uncharacterized protein YdhG (YjbR/CyaY superfamily)
LTASADIDTYIQEAPETHQAELHAIRAMIEAALPDADVTMPNGFPVYAINDEWTAGFATRKKGVMFYLMVSSVLDDHLVKLGRLRSGRSCVEWKDSAHLPLEELRQLAPQMLAEAGRRRRAGNPAI